MPRPALPLRYRLMSALLALLVLATSVGLTAERHRCRISGRSTVALLLPGLKPTAAPTPSKSGKACGQRRTDGCCDISHSQHKLDAKAASAGLAKWLPAPPAALPPALLPTPMWAGLAGTPLAASVAVGTAANSSPPGVPRAGRVLLATYCTLVV